MGFDDACFQESEDCMIRGLLGSGHPFLDGITLERLDREHSIRLNIPTPFLPFAGGFGTPSGKCEFGAEDLDYAPPVESRFGDENLRKKYPLELISSNNDDSTNTTFGFRARTDAETSLAACQDDSPAMGRSTIPHWPLRGRFSALHGDKMH